MWLIFWWQNPVYLTQSCSIYKMCGIEPSLVACRGRGRRQQSRKDPCAARSASRATFSCRCASSIQFVNVCEAHLSEGVTCIYRTLSGTSLRHTSVMGPYAFVLTCSCACSFCRQRRRQMNGTVSDGDNWRWRKAPPRRLLRSFRAASAWLSRSAHPVPSRTVVV